MRSLELRSRSIRFVVYVVLHTAAAGLAWMSSDASGVSIWWPPAVVVLVLLLTDDARWAVPTAVVGRLVSGLLLPVPFSRVLVEGTASVLAYALAVAAHRYVVARRDGDPLDLADLRTATSAVLTLAIAGPLAAAVSARGIAAVAGQEAWELFVRDATSFAVGDAAAVLTLLPAALLWWSPRPVAGSQVSRALPTAVAAATISYFALDWTVGGESVVFLTAIPVVVAALQRSSHVAVPITLAATGTAAALGFADASVLESLAVQVDITLIATASLLSAAALRSGPPRPAASDARVGHVAVPGHLDFLRQLGRLVRHARVGAAAIEVVYVVLALRSGWTGDPLPLWAAALLAPGLFLAMNALSVYLDAVHGYGRRRQLIESSLDVAVVVTLFTVLAPLQPDYLVPMGLLAIVSLVPLRLPIRESLMLTLSGVGVLAVARITEPLPWPVAPPDHTLGDVVPLVVVTVIIVSVLGWAAGQLHAYRRIATAAGEAQVRQTERAETLNDELAHRNRELESLAARLRSTVRDVDRTAAQERAAREAYERFASVVAHDVRGPLATISSMAATLRRPVGDALADEMLERIEASSRRTLQLVDRLHEHALAGATALDPVPTDLTVLVRDVLHDLSAEIGRSGSTATIVSVLPTVACDPAMVRQALQNLVGNALRHGVDRDGRAVVRVSGRITDDGAVLTVSDEGPGIPPEVADRVFDIGATGDAQRGLGLGLSTAREVAHRHGGRIWVERTGPGGTAVSLLLPATPPIPRVVLLVDGSPDQRLARRVALAAGPAPTTVLEATSLESAHALLSSHDGIDEAFVDLHMPDGPWVDLVPELRRRQVRIRLLADGASDDDRVLAGALGVELHEDPAG